MRRPAFLLTALVIAAIVVPTAVRGWWDMGHMTVAEIAYRNLDEKAKRVADEYIEHLSRAGPFPKTPDFVQTACWPDDLKGYDLEVMNGWHYTANMYVPDNFKTNVSLRQKDNVVSVLNGLARTLRRTDTPLYVRSFALAHFTHYYGDIHQPLHTTSQVSSKYPKGDRGGNLVHVEFRGHKMDLHAVWDSICQGPSESLKRPLDKEGYAKVREFADRLIQTYTISPEEKEKTSATAISKEGFALAKKVAYAGVVNGTKLTEEYIEKCRETAEERITLAGYRLATHLNKLFVRRYHVNHRKGRNHLFAEHERGDDHSHVA